MRERLALLLLALTCLALQVQPATVTVDGGIGTEFSHVFTITSEDPRPQTLTIQPHRFSTYLEDAATTSTSTITLEPFGSANVQVRGTIPVLGPETHTLTYELQDDEQTQGNFSIAMPLSGTPTLHPKIEASVDDVIADEPVTIDTTLYNFGNIITYYDLTLNVRQDGETVGELTYPQVVQVLPGEEHELTLLYTDALEPGTYDATIAATVNNDERVTTTQPFRVVLADEEQTITQGSDLTLTITGEGGQVTYIVTRGGEELLRDTIRAEREISVPTATLAPGDYDVEVRVQHAQGADTTHIDLRIRRRGLDPTTVALLITTLIIGGLFSLRPVRLRLRLAHVQYRVWRTERTLNRLVAKAHTLSETP